MKKVMKDTKIEVKNIISSMLEEEIGKYEFGKYSVLISNKPNVFVAYQYDFPICGVTATNYYIEFYLDNLVESLKAIMIFLGGRWWQKGLCKILTFNNRKKILHKLISELVAHEYRHSVQYEFLRSKGLDPDRVMDSENHERYERRCHEKDAIEFSKGKVNDLEAVFAQYL